MDTKDFLTALRKTPEAELIFELDTDKHIQPGYHVTEIMSLGYDSVDCGGVVNHWRETLVQLQGPSENDTPEFMNAAKFLGIYDEVVSKIPLQADTDLRVEYGDAEQAALHFHVDAVEAANGKLHVLLNPPGVTCKARARAQAMPVVGAVLSAVECC